MSHQTMNTDEPIVIDLPFPPSINTYWRRHGHTIYITNDGRAFRTNVLAAVLQQIGKPKALTGRIGMSLLLRRGDRRSYDIDNCAKAALDAMAHAGLFENDSQVDRLVIERGELDKPKGSMRVTIAALGESK